MILSMWLLPVVVPVETTLVAVAGLEDIGPPLRVNLLGEVLRLRRH